MTTKRTLITLAAMSILALPGPLAAQEPGAMLPDICKAPPEAGAMMDGSMNMMGGSMGMMGGGAGPGQQMMAEGMARMNTDMAGAMSAPDMDVAFVCAMIVHHRSAIDMARAELENGDDAWAKQMAQNVIDARTKEIDDAIGWLDQLPK